MKSGIQIPKVSFSEIDYSQIEVGSYFLGFNLNNAGNITVIEGEVNTPNLPLNSGINDGIKGDNASKGIKALGVPSYADDDAAGATSLTTGDIYQTYGTSRLLPVAGVLMLKQ